MARDFDISVSMIGFDKIKPTFASVSDDMRYTSARWGLRKAANVLIDAVRANAQALDDPSTGRSIAKNVSARFSTRAFQASGGDTVMFRMGIAGGANTHTDPDNKDQGAGGPTPHWRLLEFGTREMAARPFFRPGVENNLQAATDVFIQQLDASLQRNLAKL
jgi:HK97 gp10 family phage protein